MTDYDYGFENGLKYAKEELIKLVKSQEFQQGWIEAPTSMTFSEFCAEQIKEIK